jgi:hypothetical protein
MYGSFNPPLALDLTLVTPSLVIEGTLLTRLRRLSDVLNETGAEHLILSDARVMELGSRRIVAGPGVVRVQLNDVLFAHRNAPVDAGEEMRTSMQPVKSVLLVSPFTIEGKIHLAYEPEISRALDALASRFVTVSAATYWAYAVAESPKVVDQLLVSREKTHVAVPAGAPWLTEAPPDRSSGGSNTW